MSAERKALALAARQHGVLTTADAVNSGLSEKAIAVRLRAGRWRAVERGLYVVQGSRDTREQRLTIALLGTSANAVLSRRDAAVMYGVLKPAGGPIHVTIPHGDHLIAGPGRIVHQARGLGRRDVTEVGEFPCTSPNRTFLDLAGVLAPRELEAALDEALMRGLVTLEKLEKYITGRCFKGARVLKRLLRDRRNGVPQEEMERVFDRNVVKRFNLPKPKRQWPFAGNKRIDVAYPDEKVAIELDSWRWHGSLSAFRADRPRQNILELDGWMVLRFTWDAVRYRPREVAETILTALGRRGPVPASRTRVSRNRGSG